MKWFKRLIDWVRGLLLRRKLRNPDSVEREAALAAVEQVIMQTRIAPDCVSAGEIHGGCGIKIKHDEAWEWFVANDYGEAAARAIEWLQWQWDEDERGKSSSYISTRKSSGLNRAQRRRFDRARRAEQKRARKSCKG